MRLWILALAGTTFLAGMAAGRLAAAKPEQDTRPFEAYAARLESEFDLGPERARLLRELLGFYAERVAAIEREHLTTYQAARADDLAAEARQFSGWIRDKVLPPDQRERYDRMVAGSAGTGPDPLSNPR